MVSARAIFDRIAHSSIMRLNKTSMDKLFDLMNMGVKFQVLCTPHPAQVHHVSLNHADTLVSMVPGGKEVIELVAGAVTQVERAMREMSMGDMMYMRYTLLNFFQDQRIRVSLFLQENIQLSDGRIRLPRGEAVPPGTEVPGVVRYFDAAGNLSTTERFESKDMSVGTTETVAQLRSGKDRSCSLGTNVYLKHKSRTGGKGDGTASGPPKAAAAGQAAKPSVTAAENAASLTSPAAAKQAAAGIDMLAGMVGGSGADDEFKLDLFGNDDGAFDTEGFSSGSTVQSHAVKLTADPAASSLANIISSLSVDDGPGAPAGAEPTEEEDLLSMIE